LGTTGSVFLRDAGTRRTRLTINTAPRGTPFEVIDRVTSLDSVG
jgi:hypothetical protein